MQTQLLPIAFLSLILFSTSMKAQSISSPTPKPAASPDKASPGPEFEKRLADLEGQLQNIEKPQKDNWDKLTAISGLISGTVVVLIGLLVTFVLERRNKIIEDRQKNRELTVAQVQTVQSFMPLLQSGGPREIESAILAISALDASLALTLAGVYRNDGSVFALRKISSGPDVETAKKAKEILANLITVSLAKYNRGDLWLSASSLRTFYDLTDEVFRAIKAAVDPFTYGTSWILRDKETDIKFQKDRKKDGQMVAIDDRPLGEVGIKPGMMLEVVLLKPDAIDSD